MKFVLRRCLHISKKIYPSTRGLLYQWFSSTTSNNYPSNDSHKPATDEKKPYFHSKVLEWAPKAYGKDVHEYTPKPLDCPIGFSTPPQPGENTGIDRRTWRQRMDDFTDYEKHLIRRKQLTTKMATPYFREWKNMRFLKGKSFLAPPRLFRAQKALYFPNFYGLTLQKDKQFRDTTPLLRGKISIIGVFSSSWAENQIASFVSRIENPELHQIIQKAGGLAQLVQINLEDNSLKAWLVKCFMYKQRKILAEEHWDKYFLVQNELNMEIRNMIGMLNSKVGYIYLLDEECKIRWVGCGFCQEDEKVSLLNGLKKLIEDTARG